MSTKDHEGMRKSVSTTADYALLITNYLSKRESQNNKQMLSNVLQIFSHDHGLIDDGSVGLEEVHNIQGPVSI